MLLLNAAKLFGTSVFGIGISNFDSEEELSQSEIRLLASEMAKLKGTSTRDFNAILSSDRPYKIAWRIPGFRIIVHYIGRTFSCNIDSNKFLEEKFNDREVLVKVFYPYYKGRLNYDQFINPTMVGDLVHKTYKTTLNHSNSWVIGSKEDYEVTIEAANVIDGFPIYKYEVVNPMKYEGTPESYVYGILLGHFEKVGNIA